MPKQSRLSLGTFGGKPPKCSPNLPTLLGIGLEKLNLTAVHGPNIVPWTSYAFFPSRIPYSFLPVSSLPRVKVATNGYLDSSFLLPRQDDDDVRTRVWLRRLLP